MINKTNDRDRHFVELAKVISTRSKDPSTKVGAVIVDPIGRIISMGFNGFPRNMPDAPEIYADREQKYSRMVHAEMNAVLFAHRELTGCTLYTWPFLSCDRCIVHMLQAGLVRFVAPTCPVQLIERWEPIFDRTRKYISECSATYIELEEK